MTQKYSHAARRGAGFTLVELLITLAIVGILLAVSIPAVLSLREGMKMNELDASARAIFLAAQNKLTGMQSSGTLDALPTTHRQEGASLCYLTNPSDGEDIQALLPSGAIDPTVAGNYYTIVYNNATGAVRQVYYAEQSFEPAEVFPLGNTGSDVENENRKKLRREKKIGYYDGADLELKDIQQLPRPTLEIINNNELKLVATLPAGHESDKLTLIVESAQAPGIQYTFTKEAGIAQSRFEVVLDSLYAGGGTRQRFATLCPDLLPGAQFKATAALSKAPAADTIYLNSYVSREDNSLFARREGEEVTILYARHLQNLDPAFSNRDAGIRSAVQGAAIDWPEGVAFQPIDNPAGHLKLYDGRELPIRQLAVSGGDYAEGAGLFSRFQGYDGAEKILLQNVRLVDPRMDAGKYTAGTLAGDAANASVYNCMVYADAQPPHGLDQLEQSVYLKGGTVGGLLGAARDCDIAYCGVGLPLVSASANGDLGGLIGRAGKMCKVESCYAAVDQLGGRAHHAAAFIGSAPGLITYKNQEPHISNCYAVGNISAQADSIAGFMVGSPNSTTASYCAVTYLDDGGKGREIKVDAFAWGVTPNDCTSLAVAAPTVLKTEKDPQSSYDELAAWAPPGAGSQAWAKLTGLQSHPYRRALLNAPTSGIYPFPGLLAPPQADGQTAPIHHYGSWPEKPALLEAGTGLTYYEVYEDGFYGFYTVDWEGNVSQSLTQKRIRATGYGVLLPSDADIKSLGEVTAEWDYSPDAPCKEKLFDTGELALYPFTDELIKNSCDVLRSQNSAAATEIKFSAQGEFWFNPLFAASISTEGKTALATEALPLQIRTQEQLANLPDTLHIEAGYFKQTHDVYTSNWKTLANCLGSSEVFDGGGYQIFDLSEPLFSTIEYGSVRNVVIANAVIHSDLTLDTTGKKTDGVGIFTESTSSNATAIEDCTVRSSSITVKGGNAAGFAYDNLSRCTIRNCKVADTTVTSSNGSAAGFVFENHGEIQSCSFSATSSYHGAAVSAANNAAGFAYKNLDSCKIQNCKVVDTTVTSSSGSAAGFVFENRGPIQSCSFSATSSYQGAAVSAAGDAAGFANETLYSTTIKNCYAVGTVDAGNRGAGFINVNKGSIQSSYTNCATSGETASGFVMSNQTSVTSCYALLSVTSSRGNASGFADSGYGSFANCYSAAAIRSAKGKNRYGFSPGSGNLQNCFYLKASDLEAGGGTGLAYGELSGKADALSGFVAPNPGPGSTPFSPSLRNDGYPFPLIAGLHHYGDWPADSSLPQADGILGVFFYEKQADGTYLIQAAALACYTASNKLIATPLESNYAGAVAPGNPPENDFGFGLFWSKGFPFPDNKKLTWDSEKEGDFRDLNTDADLRIDANYYFVPLHDYEIDDDDEDGDVEIEVEYKHDNGNSPWNWEYEFEYDKNDKTFTIEKDD